MIDYGSSSDVLSDKQIEDDQKDIDNRLDLEEMLGTKGWALIEKLSKLEIQNLTDLMFESNDSEFSFACIQRVNGLKFILEHLISQVIESGKNAQERKNCSYP